MGTLEFESPQIYLLYIFILGFCVVLRRFCLVRHPCDITAGLFCEVTPRNQEYYDVTQLSLAQHAQSIIQRVKYRFYSRRYSRAIM